MLLIGNGKLLTRDQNGTYLENGAVLCEGRLIKAVGETAALRKQYPDAEFLDARGGVIMPGLINAHSHIYSAFARGAHCSAVNAVSAASAANVATSASSVAPSRAILTAACMSHTQMRPSPRPAVAR